LWVHVHAQAQGTRSSQTGIPLSTADRFSFILRLLGFRKQESGCKVCASCEWCRASSVWYRPGAFLLRIRMPVQMDMIICCEVN
jgi:hypothetical protein